MIFRPAHKIVVELLNRCIVKAFYLQRIIALVMRAVVVNLSKALAFTLFTVFIASLICLLCVFVEELSHTTESRVEDREEGLNYTKM